MTMNKLLAALLMGCILGMTPTVAQESADPADDRPAQETEPAAQADEEALPEIDVWAEDADTDDDVFIPTESISADSSIAFPADI